MIDIKYYEEKKKKLLEKARILQKEYINYAFKFTNEIKELDSEIKFIDEWIKEKSKDAKK